MSALFSEGTLVQACHLSTSVSHFHFKALKTKSGLQTQGPLALFGFNCNLYPNEGQVEVEVEPEG